MWIQLIRAAVVTFVVCGVAAPNGLAQGGSTLDSDDSVLQSLTASDLEARRNAATTLRSLDRDVQRRALPTLIELLMTDNDGQVRLAVFDTVTDLGPDASSVIPALVHALQNDFGGRRQEELHQDYRAALALAAIGGPAVNELRALLTERKENVRAEAAMALGRIGPDAEAAIPDLIALLGDRSERIQREAALALGQIGTAALDPLIDASTNEDVGIRAWALEGLGQMPESGDRSVAVTLEGLDDPAPEVRAAALRALIRFELADETLSTILVDNLRHEDESVRLAVVNLLVKRRDLLLKLAEELEPLLTAEHEGVARHATFLLERVGPDAASILLDALKHDQSRIEPIAEALARIGRPIAGMLTEEVHAPEPRVRRGAALALGQIRPPVAGAVRTLSIGLEDPDSTVRASFLSAIGQLGARDADSVPLVRAMLLDESAAIRSQAIEILSRTAPRDQQLLDDLKGRLDDEDAGVQRRSIESIRTLGPRGRDVLGVIIEKLDSPHAEVRIAAAELIGSHGPAAAEAVPALCSLLDDPDPEAQTIALQTLGSVGKGAQPAFERITTFLDVESVAVREAATYALGSLELDAEVVRPALAKALQDDAPEVRTATLRSIQRFGSQAALFLPNLILAAEHEEDRRSIERLLRRFERSGPDERSIPEIIELLEHEQDAVRLLATRFLGLAGSKAEVALSALERLRDDPNSEVREQAEAAREQIENGPTASQG